jgi:hypothetical protein
MCHMFPPFLCFLPSLRNLLWKENVKCTPKGIHFSGPPNTITSLTQFGFAFLCAVTENGWDIT